MPELSRLPTTRTWRWPRDFHRERRGTGTERISARRQVLDRPRDAL